MLEALFQSSRTTKRLLSLAYDTLALLLAFYLATALRLGTFSIPFGVQELIAVAITIAASLFIFMRMGLYRAILRYLSTPAMLTLVTCVLLSGLLLATANFFIDARIPRSVPLIYIMTALILIGSPRLLVRSVIILLHHQSQRQHKESVIVYGAGHTGHQLILALQGSRHKVVALVDDDPALHRTQVSGIRVYAPKNLDSLIKSTGATKILLALGHAPHSVRTQVIERVEKLGVLIQTIPPTTQILSGKVSLEHIQDVDIEDLLSRDPVRARPELLGACITSKAVMVTGAGGSIGSELCRQILRQSPKLLVLLELNEYSLYSIEKELQSLVREQDLSIQVIGLLGSVQSQTRLEAIMRTFAVQTVYHAAAYKHVPLVESNIVEGVLNNVFGTWYCAEAAIRTGVESFVLISTDKAVRPTNVMGASKRMAELVLQGLAKRQNGTRFTMVRFGNVLGSSGSVVPLFREQIKKGGPITVTHPEIIRYFMTIPEAAELVIQAGSMGLGGDVFVLDMGEPVKILDLAKRMIKLSGLEMRSAKNPTGDISIEFTGLRPGEKLYEELLIGDTVSDTEHARILRAEEVSLSWEETHQLLMQLDNACQDWRGDRVKELLIQAPTDFRSTDPLCDAVMLGQQAATQPKPQPASRQPAALQKEPRTQQELPKTAYMEAPQVFQQKAGPAADCVPA